MGGRISVTFYVSPKENLKLPTSRFLLLNPVTQCRFNEVIFISLPCFFFGVGRWKIKEKFRSFGVVWPENARCFLWRPVLSRVPVESAKSGSGSASHDSLQRVFVFLTVSEQTEKKLGNNIFLYLKIQANNILCYF